MDATYEKLKTRLVDDMECCVIAHERPSNDPAALDTEHRIIYLDKSLPLVSKIIALAHEMGHLVDLDGRCKGNWSRYRGEYISHPLQGEMFAWLNAIVLMRNEGFHNWEVVISDVEEHISTYVNSEKQIKDKNGVIQKILKIISRKVNQNNLEGLKCCN